MPLRTLLSSSKPRKSHPWNLKMPTLHCTVQHIPIVAYKRVNNSECIFVDHQENPKIYVKIRLLAKTKCNRMKNLLKNASCLPVNNFEKMWYLNITHRYCEPSFIMSTSWQTLTSWTSTLNCCKRGEIQHIILKLPFPSYLMTHIFSI